MLFDGDLQPQGIRQQPGEATTVTISHGAGTLLQEVEDRLRHLQSMENSPRKITMARFHELERTPSVDSDLLTSGHGSRVTSPRTGETFCKYRDPEAQL